MADNPLIVALLKEYQRLAVITRTQVGVIIGKGRNQVAGICGRANITGWPRITAETIRKRTCCFPLGTPGGSDFRLCGRPRMTAHPFLCQMHEDKRWIGPGKIVTIE